MKPLFIMLITAMVVLTGCTSMAEKEPVAPVARQFMGTDIPSDPMLRQVRELEQKQVLNHVVVSESFPVQITATGPENVLTCLSNPNGRWIEEKNECEQMGAQTCEELGGQFNECASACRNQPGANGTDLRGKALLSVGCKPALSKQAESQNACSP
ncbi:hypothetical protein ACH42_02745 [Endozoicomonas sp. (ex Bugula neritina AB1)]|nr:hypothetical protein ACH42_02745 [Endozoicomonas sp. (ex Bugula neritina AB1)]